MAEWTTIAGGQVPQTPEQIENLTEDLNKVVKFLSGFIDTALATLETIKAFAVGNIDPILAIIDTAISEIESILNDVLNAGFYFTGDWYLLTPPFENLRGGYPEFEGRMAGRFIDKSDKTRPQFGNKTPVFALFLYSSVSFTNIHVLIGFLKSLTEFFNFDFRLRPAQSTPISLKVSYRQSGKTSVVKNILDSLIKFDGEIVDTATVTWKMPESPKNPRIPFPTPPPFAFRISVSTTKEGLPLIYDRPIAFSKKVEGPDGSLVQDRESGQVVIGGQALFLYGGADDIELDEELFYNNSLVPGENNQIKEGAVRVFARRRLTDNVPIPLELLKRKRAAFTTTGTEDQHFLQKTFYIRSEDILGAFGSLSPSFFKTATYRLDIPLTDMPFEADFVLDINTNRIIIREDTIKRPETFYVRVASVSAKIRDGNDFRYVLQRESMQKPNEPGFAILPKTTLKEQLTTADISSQSPPTEVNFPSEQSRSFLNILTTAVAVLALSRSDLPVVEEDGQEITVGVSGGNLQFFVDGKAALATGLERFGGLVPEIVGARNPNTYFDIDDQDDEKSDVYEFRRSFLAGCRAVASKIYDKIGSNGVIENNVLDNSSLLETWKWSDTTTIVTVETEGGSETISTETYNFPDLTILESLDSGRIRPGVARNPFASGILLGGPPWSEIVGRTPGFFERSNGSGGSADFSPVLVVTNKLNLSRVAKGAKTIFCRNLFPAEIYEAANIALGLSTSPTTRPEEDGAWVAVRFGGLFPSIEQFLLMILDWTKSLRDGVKDVTSAIQDYIDFIESRILELQALITRIDSVLFSVATFSFPNMSALVVNANGVEGVVKEFIAATEKPQDGATLYSGGGVLVGAGLPDFVVELIKDLLSL